MTQLRNCSVIGVVGPLTDRVSLGINLGSLGIPGVSVHHVGISVDDLIFESTTSKRPVCQIQKVLVQGVQAHTLQELIDTGFYKQIWQYPLRPPLYKFEEDRLREFVHSKLGVPYDMRGAAESGGVIFNTLNYLFKGENLQSLFCSEFVAASLNDINRLRTDDASRWNPNKLVRYLVRKGLCYKPERLA